MCNVHNRERILCDKCQERYCTVATVDQPYMWLCSTCASNPIFSDTLFRDACCEHYGHEFFGGNINNLPDELGEPS